MAKILDYFQRKSLSEKLVPPGVYHYISPPDDPRNYRLHLRVDSDGMGVLIINASTILHLNETGTIYAYFLVINKDPEDVASEMVKKYNIDFTQATQDYMDFNTRIQSIVNTPDLDPVMYLGIDRKKPFSGYIPAPYRLDCALTYELPEKDEPTQAPQERISKQLSLEEWLSVINTARDAGIPHIVFTGGEPTLSEFLPELLQQAENNNQVTGLLSDGIKLLNHKYLDHILSTGLDHLMLLLQPDQKESWQVLQKVIPEDLFVAVHLTITDQTFDQIRETIDRLVRLGVHGLSLSTSNPEKIDLVQMARDYSAEVKLELIWNLPVPYSASNPIAYETSNEEIREGAGRAWLYIEPDGDVLPAQGINNILGNIIQDPWESIWNNALTQKIAQS